MDLNAALQAAVRARRALDAITPCPATTTLVRYMDDRTGPVHCDLVEHHDVMAGTRHRARLSGRTHVEWDATTLDLVIR